MHGQAHSLLLKKTTYISGFRSLWVFHDSFIFFFFLIWHEKCPLSVLGLFVIEQEKAYFKPENAVMSTKDQHSI